MADVSNLPLAETVFDDDQGSTPPRRDRIVILGRRASGKTVYLSVLYEKYWKSLDSLTLKAVSGNTHSDLIRVVEGLREGRWPAATLETQYCDLEIKYKGRKHLMVTLDYAGELFRRAFVEDITDTPETAALVEHIDAAAAVILLIDPTSLVGDSSDARIDDDFGMTQAVTRIRNWPGGKDVPFVVVFTKADVSRQRIQGDGGVVPFMTKHLPALARTLKKIQIFQVAAVNAKTLPDGTKIPRPNKLGWHVEKPLLYCLDQIELKAELDLHRAQQRRSRVEWAKRQKEQRNEKHRTNLRVFAIVGSMIVIAACVIALVWARNL